MRERRRAFATIANENCLHIRFQSLVAIPASVNLVQQLQHNSAYCECMAIEIIAGIELIDIDCALAFAQNVSNSLWAATSNAAAHSIRATTTNANNKHYKGP